MIALRFFLGGLGGGHGDEQRQRLGRVADARRGSQMFRFVPRNLNSSIARTSSSRAPIGARHPRDCGRHGGLASDVVVEPQARPSVTPRQLTERRRLLNARSGLVVNRLPGQHRPTKGEPI